MLSFGILTERYLYCTLCVFYVLSFTQKLLNLFLDARLAVVVVWFSLSFSCRVGDRENT